MPHYEIQYKSCLRQRPLMEWYRRGHNEHDWKSCDGQKPSEGSNPSHSAIKTAEGKSLWRFFSMAAPRNSSAVLP